MAGAAAVSRAITIIIPGTDYTWCSSVDQSTPSVPPKVTNEILTAYGIIFQLDSKKGDSS